MWSKRIRAAALILILAMILALPGFAAGEKGEVRLSLKSSGGRHLAYLHGYEDGSFKPNGYITRAEEAQMLYNLLEERPSERAALADVKKTDWFYDAVGLLAAPGGGVQLFRPVGIFPLVQRHRQGHLQGLGQRL